MQCRFVGEFAELLEGINSRRMPVAPVDLDRVTADGLNFQRMDVIGNRSAVEPTFPRPLVDTVGAAAGQPELSHLILALLPVGPPDLEASRASLLNLDRSVASGVVHCGEILPLDSQRGYDGRFAVEIPGIFGGGGDGKPVGGSPIEHKLNFFKGLWNFNAQGLPADCEAPDIALGKLLQAQWVVG